MRQFQLSASLIKTFLQCKYKFLLQYYEKKPKEKHNAFLALGIAVHAALERLWSYAMESKDLTEKEIDEVIKVYYKEAAKNGLSELEFLEDGLSMVKDRIKLFDKDEKVLGLEISFGRRGHRKLCTDGGTPISGSIDKLIEINSSTLAVIDYKTSRTALTQSEADKDIQLYMYDYAVSKMFPEYENIILVLDYIRLGEVTTYRTPDQREMFGKYVDAIYEEIGELVEDKAYPEINDYCGWCDFKDYCPNYKESLNEPARKVVSASTMSDDDLVREYMRLGNVKKLVESRERELNMTIVNRVRSSGDIDIDDMVVGLRQNSRVNYHAKDVFSLVPLESFVNMVRPNKRDVDAYLSKHPDKYEEFSRIANISFSSPIIKKQKK